MISWRTLFITLWNVLGLFLSPKGILRNSKWSSSALNAVLGISRSSISIWWNPQARSKVEKYWYLPNLSKIGDVCVRKSATNGFIVKLAVVNDYAPFTFAVCVYFYRKYPNWARPGREKGSNNFLIKYFPYLLTDFVFVDFRIAIGLAIDMNFVSGYYSMFNLTSER